MPRTATPASAARASIGCSQQGRLLVVVDSDIDGLAAVTMRVRRASAAEGETTEFTLARDPLPLRLGVEPVGGSGLVRIEAIGSRGGAAVVESAATINVLPGPTRRMYLDARCEGVLDCDDDETCVAGVCEPVPMVEPEDLAELGSDAGEVLDGGGGPKGRGTGRRRCGGHGVGSQALRP